VSRVMNSKKPALKNVDEESFEAVTLDLALARENFGSDEILLCEIATVFIEDVPLLIEEMQQACARGDTATVCRMAHSLKGLCATFGAEPARTYAQRIEHDCCDGSSACVTSDRVHVLVQSLHQTIDALRSELRLTA